MKVLFIFAVLFVAANAHVGVRYMGNSADPNKPGYCLHKEFNLSIKEGEQVKPADKCIAFTCNPDGVIQIHDCPYYPSDGRCTITPTDVTKAYPDCCAFAKCF